MGGRGQKPLLLYLGIVDTHRGRLWYGNDSTPVRVAVLGYSEHQSYLTQAKSFALARDKLLLAVTALCIY